MRLLRCHIENFGKFSDYTVDFGENPCVFNESNGWGKSTIAAFIKVMFYGFANEKKRGDVLERERVRYKPWQGGVYGGELAFEAGGKRYLMNRTFGKKESEDTFALYDAETNLPSGDFTSNIGEELFQINQESFLRTVFIAQNDCDTAATDSINAKIGNLTDCLDDMNNYEVVQQKLKDLRNSLTPSRKTGALKQQKEEIAQLKDELRRAESAEQAVTELEERLAASKEERSRLLSERKELQEKWELRTGQREMEAKRSHYVGIRSQFEEKQKAVESGLLALGGNVPERDVLQSMQEQRNELLKLESEAETNRLSQEQRERLKILRARFEEGVPGEEELRRGQELSLRLEELQSAAMRDGLSREEQQEYVRLKDRFGVFAERPGVSNPESVDFGRVGGRGGDVDRELDEAIRQWDRYIDKKSGLGTKRATLSSLQAMEQSVQPSRKEKGLGGVAVFGMALALCLLAAGGVLMALRYTTVGLGLLAVGVVAVAASMVWICLARAKREAEPARGAEELQRQSAGTARLEQEIAGDEAVMAEARRYTAEILHRFGMDLADWGEDERRTRDELYTLKNDWRRLGRLRAMELDYQGKDYEAQMQKLREQIVAILAPFCGKHELRDEQSGHLGVVCASLEKERADFVVLESRDGKCAKAEEAAAELQARLRQFLERHGQGEAGDLDMGLGEIARILNDYENDCHDRDRLKDELEAFEASYDIRNFERPTEEVSESEEELKERMEQTDERASALLDNIHSYQLQLDERQQDLDNLQLQKEKLDFIEQEYEKTYVYYERLGITAEYLEKAKESLSAKYIGPVYDSFKRNYTLLSGEDADAFRMDANICVTKRDAGEQREVRAFSSGSQDLINIVLRVALVDAMYEGEKPFLVLDDSFVNLDDKRLKLAGDFLHRIAEDYQVIYFTCHESRAM